MPRPLPRASVPALCLAAVVPAQSWAEVGDAGELTGTAQQAVGAGNLTQIMGTLGSGDADVYLIQIHEPTAFQATTVGGTALDTKLMLFDQDGRGVAQSDDLPGGVLQSRITGQFVVGPGRYYLAISNANRAPASLAGPLWDAAGSTTTERRADGGGRDSALAFWLGLPPVSGAYTIALVGAAFAPNQVSLPGNHHLSETANFTPGSLEYFRSAPNGRFQVLYEGSHFVTAGVTGPITLTRLQMRAEDTVQNRGGQIYLNMNLTLANTTLTANTLGTSFANNLSAATTTVGPTATISAKTIKRALGLCPNNDVVDLDLQALGIPFVHDPTGARPNLLIDVSWPNAGPGANNTNTVAIQDATGGPAVVRGRGLTATSSAATTGTLRDPPILKLDFLGSGGDDVLVPARVLATGAACGGSTSAIYMEVPHTERFVLASDPVARGITFTPDVYPSPTYYAVTLGAPAVDLTKVNPAPSSTTEDAFVTHALAMPFSYPGGSTSALRVDDNGFVRLTSAAVMSPWDPTRAKWLGVNGEGAVFAPFWHDFSSGRNTTTHPNSGLHVRTDSGIVYATWLNVGRFSTVATPGGQSVNTMQCVVNPMTGVVQFRYGTMDPISGNTRGGTVTGITGFSRGRVGLVPSADPGSTDLAHELPRSTGVEGGIGNLRLTATSVVPPLPVHLPGRMFPGQQIRWNVTNVPANTLFGLWLLDLNASQPGLALPGLTPPGCTLGTSLAAVVHEAITLPGNTVNGTVPFVVPPGFDGAELHAQFVAVKAGPGTLELVPSNTLRHVLGKQ